MNDNDIIKALECCLVLGECKDCPEIQHAECLTLTDQAYDLVKRQKAEIERLEAYNANLEAANSYICNTLLDKVSKARSEAIKEFAEKVKENQRAIFNTIYSKSDYCKMIDKLVRETMEGD